MNQKMCGMISRPKQANGAHWETKENDNPFVAFIMQIGPF